MKSNQNSDTIIQCCICMKIKVINKDVISYVKIDIPDNIGVSSTYCPECFSVHLSKVMAECRELGLLGRK